MIEHLAYHRTRGMTGKSYYCCYYYNYQNFCCYYHQFTPLSVRFFDHTSKIYEKGTISCYYGINSIKWKGWEPLELSLGKAILNIFTKSTLFMFFANGWAHKHDRHPSKNVNALTVSIKIFFLLTIGKAITSSPFDYVCPARSTTTSPPLLPLLAIG